MDLKMLQNSMENQMIFKQLCGVLLLRYFSWTLQKWPWKSLRRFPVHCCTGIYIYIYIQVLRNTRHRAYVWFYTFIFGFFYLWSLIRVEFGSSVGLSSLMSINVGFMLDHPGVILQLVRVTPGPRQTNEPDPKSLTAARHCFGQGAQTGQWR